MVNVKFFKLKIRTIYSQPSLRRTPSGPASGDRLFEVCFSHLDEMPYSRYVSQFLEISSNTVTCTVTGKRVNRVVVVTWLSGRLATERKIVGDALARNQGRKTGSIEEAAKE